MIYMLCMLLLQHKEILMKKNSSADADCSIIPLLYISFLPLEGMISSKSLHSRFPKGYGMMSFSAVYISAYQRPD